VGVWLWQAVNLDPRECVYKDVGPSDLSTVVPMRTIKKQVRAVGGRTDSTAPPPSLVRSTRVQVDPSWVAKQELRPTVDDFFTPDLEMQAFAHIRARPPHTAPAPAGKREAPVDVVNSLLRTVML
jgi:hypothetical protein